MQQQLLWPLTKEISVYWKKNKNLGKQRTVELRTLHSVQKCYFWTHFSPHLPNASKSVIFATGCPTPKDVLYFDFKINWAMAINPFIAGLRAKSVVFVFLGSIYYLHVCLNGMFSTQSILQIFIMHNSDHSVFGVTVFNGSYGHVDTGHAATHFASRIRTI